MSATMEYPAYRRPGPLETSFMALLQRAMKGRLFPDILHHWERVEAEQRALIYYEFMLTMHACVLFRIRGGKRSLVEEQSRTRRELVQRAFHSVASTGLLTVAAMQGIQDHFGWVAPRAEQHRCKQEESYTAFLEQRRVLARRFEATRLLQRVGRGMLWRVLSHISRVNNRHGLTTRSQEWERAFDELLAARKLIAREFFRLKLTKQAIAFAEGGLSDERTSSRAAQRYLQERLQRKQQRQRMVTFLSGHGLEYDDRALVVYESLDDNNNNDRQSGGNARKSTGAADDGDNSFAARRRRADADAAAATAASLARRERGRREVTAFLQSDPCTELVPLQPAPWAFSVRRDELDQRAYLSLEFILAAETLERWALWRSHIRRLVLTQEHIPRNRVDHEMRRVWRTIEVECVALSQREHMQRQFLAELAEMWRRYYKSRAKLKQDLINRGILPDEGVWDYDDKDAPDFSYNHFRDDVSGKHSKKSGEDDDADGGSSKNKNKDDNDGNASSVSSFRPAGSALDGEGGHTIGASSTTRASVVAAATGAGGGGGGDGDASTLRLKGSHAGGDDDSISAGGGGGGAAGDNSSVHNTGSIHPADDPTETGTQISSMDPAHLVAWDRTQGHLVGDPLSSKPPLPSGGGAGGNGGGARPASGTNAGGGNSGAPQSTADLLGAAFSRPNSAANSRNNSRPPSGKVTPQDDLRRNDTMVIAGGGGGGGGGALQKQDTMVVAGGAGRPGRATNNRNDDGNNAGIVGNPFAGRQPSRPSSSGAASAASGDSDPLGGRRPNSGAALQKQDSLIPVGGGGGAVQRPPQRRPGTAGSDASSTNHDPNRLQAQDSVFAEILEQKRQRMNQPPNRRKNGGGGDDDDDLGTDQGGGGRGGGGGGGGDDDDGDNFDEWSLDSKASIRAKQGYWI